MTRQSTDEQTVLEKLRSKRKSELLDYLRAALQEMTPKQRGAAFADLLCRLPRRTVPAATVDAGSLRREIAKFRRDSLARKYYRPFMIDSKNFMHVPTETSAWCDRFARLAKDTCRLTKQGEHVAAVRCFAVLYELLEAMESGDSQIVFAHELGGWMISADEKVWLGAYLQSLAATTTPEAFARAAAPMLWRDSTQSFAANVSASAMRVATADQRAALEAERLRRGIRTEPDPRLRSGRP